MNSKESGADSASGAQAAEPAQQSVVETINSGEAYYATAYGDDVVGLYIQFQMEQMKGYCDGGRANGAKRVREIVFQIDGKEYEVTFLQLAEFLAAPHVAEPKGSALPDESAP